MEDWSKDALEILETVTDEVEQFFQDFSDGLDSVADEFYQAVTTEVDVFWQEVLEPFLGNEFEFEEQDEDIYSFHIYTPLVNRLEPTTSKNPACIGCRHYHGHIYNGNLLVCGMHPYGWEEESCPDWENLKDWDLG
ncbi:MAG: hypothetical protein WBG70_20305 [Spirulinaceae cyanobacterium]